MKYLGLKKDEDCQNIDKMFKDKYCNMLFQSNAMTMKMMFTSKKLRIFCEIYTGPIDFTSQNVVLWF